MINKEQVLRGGRGGVGMGRAGKRRDLFQLKKKIQSSATFISACLNSVNFLAWRVTFSFRLSISQGFPGALVVKNLPAQAGDARDAGSIPGSGKAPGGGHGNPLQYSRPGKFLDRGAWLSAQSMGSRRAQHDAHTLARTQADTDSRVSRISQFSSAAQS